MNLKPDLIEPPWVAVSLIELFASTEVAESILGDLLEEFSAIASASGIVFAQRWYWRQTVKTVLQLAALGFRSSPWLITATVGGGFLMRKVLARLVEPGMFAAIERSHVYEHHFRAYVFLATTGIDLGHLITFLFIGLVVGQAAKGKEMVATTTLALIFDAMAIVAFVAIAARAGFEMPLSRFPWNFADSLAIVISGAMVKAHRLALAKRALRP